MLYDGVKNMTWGVYYMFKKIHGRMIFGQFEEIYVKVFFGEAIEPYFTFILTKKLFLHLCQNRDRVYNPYI